MAIWLPVTGQLTKGEADLAGRAGVGGLPHSTWVAELWLQRQTPTGPLSFSFTAICHYDHYYYIYMNQLLGGNVRMLQMAVCHTKMRHECAFFQASHRARAWKGPGGSFSSLTRPQAQSH